MPKVTSKVTSKVAIVTSGSGSRCSDWCGGAGSYRLSKVVAPYLQKRQTCFSGYSPGTIASENITSCILFFREK